MKTVERFSNRVDNYVKYRPGYPVGVLELFRDEMGLTADSAIADIGSGTGLSSKLFLDNGNTVYGVEPNANMREAAAEFLKAFPNFRNTDGTAENTTLSEASVDFVIAAQAFHWFHAEKTRAEFQRILKPGGYAALIWNERQLDTTPFLAEYEQLLLKFANDYTKVRHDNINEESLKDFFQNDFRRATFDNLQVLDFDGLKGRVSSSSYMPSETDETYAPMVEELKTLFAKHAENDRISVFYDTNVFYTQY
jgi:SAM-dependent methyltransferase